MDATFPIFSTAFLLFFILDPLGNVPLLLSILKNIDKEKHSKIIIREMLIALKPEELGEANAQRAKQLLDKYYKKGEIWYDPVGEIWNAASNDVKRNKSSIKRRVEFLERQYLKPTLYSNNKKDIDGSFQAYLSAMGNFEFELLIEPNIACSNLNFLPPKLDINFKYAFNLAKCENGKVTAVKQKISTNKIYLEGINLRK